MHSPPSNDQGFIPSALCGFTILCIIRISNIIVEQTEAPPCVLLGAAQGRITTLDNPARTGKQFCPHPTEVYNIVVMNGHEIKLVGKTGETCE